MSTKASKASTAKSATTSSSTSSSASSSSTAADAAVPRLSRGTVIAYLSIVVASVLGLLHVIPVYPHMMVLTVATIYIGSHNSLVTHSHDSSSVTETMQTKDALLFPLIGSVVLFSLYVVFKVFPKEYVNVLIKSYFFVFGFIVLSNKLHSLLQHSLPPATVTQLSAVSFTVTNPLTVWPLTYLAAKEEPSKPAEAAEAADKTDDEKKSSTTTAAAAASAAVVVASEDDRIPITPLYAISMGLALLVAVYYLYSNNWLCSNLFGIAFSIQGIELLSLGSYLNGAILLCGLFLYDIFCPYHITVTVHCCLRSQPTRKPPADIQHVCGVMALLLLLCVVVRGVRHGGDGDSGQELRCSHQAALPSDVVGGATVHARPRRHRHTRHLHRTHATLRLLPPQEPTERHYHSHSHQASHRSRPR